MIDMKEVYANAEDRKENPYWKEYYPALLEALKKVSVWNDAWWLLRYQMMTMTETFKRLL